MNWFPREYLGPLTIAAWCTTIALIALVPDWLANRRQRRHAATAAPESRPKSAE